MNKEPHKIEYCEKCGRQKGFITNRCNCSPSIQSESLLVQTGEGHCYYCHKDCQYPSVHLVQGMEITKCTEKCGKWFPSLPNSEERCNACEMVNSCDCICIVCGDKEHKGGKGCTSACHPKDKRDVAEVVQTKAKMPDWYKDKEKKCELVDHTPVWAGDGYFCSKCMRKFVYACSKWDCSKHNGGYGLPCDDDCNISCHSKDSIQGEDTSDNWEKEVEDFIDKITVKCSDRPMYFDVSPTYVEKWAKSFISSLLTKTREDWENEPMTKEHYAEITHKAVQAREAEIVEKLKEICNKCRTERGLATAIGNFISKLESNN